MADFIEAVTGLVKKVNLPPQYHSIYGKTETDLDGEFKRSICVSWHPKMKNPPELPTEHMGYPVTIVDWPKDL